jgi:succinate dehydrogenase hydrophobic anchor subunit
MLKDNLQLCGRVAKLSFFFACLVVISSILLSIWATVGTWRSAERYIIEHPSRNVFGYLAMLSIVLGYLKAAAELAIEFSKFIK